MGKKDQIDKDRLPQHIAIIMDGNGRWAKQHGKSRIFGHKNGVKSVNEVVEGAAELGIKHLTLYAFSTENWSRPKVEITALMGLLVTALKKESKNLNKNEIRLSTIGDTESLPSKCRKELLEAIDLTANNKRMNLILALGYSAKWELVSAMKNIAGDIDEGKLKAEEIDEDIIKNYLCTNDIPDPELLIRTSGENRISNFLLWQIAYAELYFTDVLWPDFRKENLYDALLDYQQRERRFGKTSEQYSL